VLEDADAEEYAAPPAYPMYTQAPTSRQAVQQYAPPPPPMQQNYSSGTPFWVWMALGAGIAFVFGKVQEFRRNPMAFLMGKNSMGAGGAGGPDIMEMMKQMQAARGSGGMGADPFGGFASPPSATTINTTASEVKPPTEWSPPQTPPADNSSASGSEWNAPQPPPANSSSFADAPAPSSGTTPDSTSPTPRPSSFFSDTSAPTSASVEDTSQSEALVENLLDMVSSNPEMQKQMEAHLPDTMKGPDIWEWVRKNPEMKKQLAKQLAPGLTEAGMVDGLAKGGMMPQDVRPTLGYPNATVELCAVLYQPYLCYKQAWVLNLISCLINGTLLLGLQECHPFTLCHASWSPSRRYVTGRAPLSCARICFFCHVCFLNGHRKSGSMPQCHLFGHLTMYAPGACAHACSRCSHQTVTAPSPSDSDETMHLQAVNMMQAQGIDPDETLALLMKDPELLQLMSKPHVTQAMVEMQKDPSKVQQYLTDPDVSKVVFKMTQIQAQVAQKK
jgi:hypothetical protein